MKLPKASELIVEREKVLGYLLNPLHRYGAPKERFFTAFGFRASRWEILGEALREHGRTHEIVRAPETGFGPRYTVEVIEYSYRPPASHSHGLAIRRWHNCTQIDNRLSSREFMTIKEHDCVVLTADLRKEGLKAGDVGTVVHIHGDGVAYEVEFMTFAGRTIAVATVEASDIRPVGERDVSHVRELQSA